MGEAGRPFQPAHPMPAAHDTCGISVWTRMQPSPCPADTGADPSPARSTRATLRAQGQPRAAAVGLVGSPKPSCL